MPTLNKFMAIGNLTRDIEITAAGDTSVGNTGLAINEKYKDEERTVFIDMEIWGKMAETVAEWRKKGDPIFVEGSIKFHTWEKDGVKRSRHTLRADNIQFLNKRGETVGEVAADVAPF